MFGNFLLIFDKNKLFFKIILLPLSQAPHTPLTDCNPQQRKPLYNGRLNMIKLENINKTYNNGSPLHVLKGIDLDVEKGELVSIMGASEVLRILGKRLGVETNITTYVARHSFASVLKKSGVNIALISEALGHSDLATTQIYLDSFDNEQVDKAMKNLL